MFLCVSFLFLTVLSIHAHTFHSVFSWVFAKMFHCLSAVTTATQSLDVPVHLSSWYTDLSRPSGTSVYSRWAG